MVFTIFFCLFLSGLLLVDYIFLPRSSRKAWSALAVAFGLAALAAVFQRPVEVVRIFLGVGRTVDLVLYVSTALLVRELFLSRSRDSAKEEQLTQLVRQLSMKSARKL